MRFWITGKIVMQALADVWCRAMVHYMHDCYCALMMVACWPECVFAVGNSRTITAVLRPL